MLLSNCYHWKKTYLRHTGWPAKATWHLHYFAKTYPYYHPCQQKAARETHTRNTRELRFQKRKDRRVPQYKKSQYLAERENHAALLNNQSQTDTRLSLAGKRDRPYLDGRYREAARPSGQPEYTEHPAQPTDVPSDYGFQPNLSRPSKTSDWYLPTRKTTGIESHLRSGTLCRFTGFHILPANYKKTWGNGTRYGWNWNNRTKETKNCSMPGKI